MQGADTCLKAWSAVLPGVRDTPFFNDNFLLLTINHLSPCSESFLSCFVQEK